ncbi:MAG: hypothetical protein ABIH63_00560 [archaeon]
MSVKLERLSSPLGEAVMVTVPLDYQKGVYNTYGEVYCPDPFTLRVLKYGMGTYYNGVLSTPSRRDEEGFKIFSEIAGRLEPAFGISIPHKLEDYVVALDKGLALPLYRDHPNFFVRPEAKGFPKFPDLFKKYHEKSFSKKEIGQIENKGFLLEKIIREHQRYEEAKKSLDNVDECKKISARLEDYFECFTELCEQARWYKGIIVEYEEKGLQDVFEFFNYVLRGGNPPGLPKTAQTKKSGRKPTGTDPIETNFINPWDVDPPKIKDE